MFLLPEQQVPQRVLRPVLFMGRVHTIAPKHVLYTSASLEAHLKHLRDSTRWHLSSGHASMRAAPVFMLVLSSEAGEKGAYGASKWCFPHIRCCLLLSL